MRLLISIIMLATITKVSGQTADTTKALFRSIKEAVIEPLSVTRLAITSPDDFARLGEISKLQNLEYLSLKGYDLNAFPTQLFELRSLKVLDLSENRFEVLPEEFSKLETLKELYMNT